MDISEKRIIGSLLLLAGITFLSMGLLTGQLDKVVEFVTKAFEPAIAGLP
jgi:hypothetical protein